MHELAYTRGPVRRPRARFTSLAAAVLGLTLAVPATLAAQSLASVQGFVTDDTGASLPGVTIELVDLERGQRRTAVTNQGGFFALRAVPSGEVRPVGIAGRFPPDPAGGRSPARGAEPRGGPAPRLGGGRRDRAGHRAGPAPRSGADRGRRLRDRGRDCQPADLGPRLRAVRPPETDRSGGRQGKDLAERPARRELGIHHRRRGREERLLRLRTGRAGEGGRRAPWWRRSPSRSSRWSPAGTPPRPAAPAAAP